ncbi:MAG TPA: XdhC family protein [Acidobacteriaceae bacterium]|nr:XdhC family protein [Acidobacteriaceae bacterium]
MMERRQILELWQQRQGQDAVLVTLTCATGSSYRHPGAHVLLLADGRHAGTISGGCLEAEIARKAFWLTRSGAVMQRYSTLFDDTAEIPFGLGCGGEIDILLEPANTPECEALIEAMRASLHGKSRIAITTLPAESQPLQRVILTTNEETIFASATVSSTAEKFTEHLNPPQRLILFGAGDDAQPLVNMAALLGWSVLVADGRPQLALRERFPAAECIILLDKSLSIAPLEITGKDAIVLMTHSFEQDRALLVQLLGIAPRYLGVLGARHRSSLLVREVAAILGWSMEACAACLHAPVGLNLGGDAPESIAFSILADAHARCLGGDAAPRRITAEEMKRHLAERSNVPTPVCSLDAAVSISNFLSSRSEAEGPASLSGKK